MSSEANVLRAQSLRVAIVHDWVESYAGSERVLEQFLEILPHADLFTLVDFVPADNRFFLSGHTPRTSFIQKLPFARRHFRYYLPLFPLAVESWSFADYDLILTSSHSVAKGIIAGPDQLHICYCYSPMRYAWDHQEAYLADRKNSAGIMGWLTRYMLHRLRVWDRVSSVGVDHFIGISEFISRRIWRCYRRESSVIYPPVDTESFPLLENKSDFYLVLGRMVPYKKVDLIARAFKRMPNRKLVLAGNGPDYARIADMVKDAPNIVMTGFIPHTQAVDLMQRAKAFVFAAEEDFGIAPLEASACGTPVIAYRSGGASETIRDIALPEPSGLFFDRQTEDSLIAAVKKFEIEGHAIKPAYCRKQAMRFSRVVFREKIEEYLEAAIRAYQEDKAG